MGKKKKDNQQVRITLVGSMATTVTGSCYKINFLDKTYIVDFGSYQEKDMKRNFYVNSELANLIKREDLSGVLLTHSHVRWIT